MQGGGDARESVAGTLQVAHRRGSSRKQAKSAAECCTWCVEGQGQARELAATVGWLVEGRGGDCDGPLGGCVAPPATRSGSNTSRVAQRDTVAYFPLLDLSSCLGSHAGGNPTRGSTREGVVSGPQRWNAWTLWQRSDLCGNQAVIAVVGTSDIQLSNFFSQREGGGGGGERLAFLDGHGGEPVIGSCAVSDQPASFADV